MIITTSGSYNFEETINNGTGKKINCLVFNSGSRNEYKIPAEEKSNFLIIKLFQYIKNIFSANLEITLQNTRNNDSPRTFFIQKKVFFESTPSHCDLFSLDVYNKATNDPEKIKVIQEVFNQIYLQSQLAQPASHYPLTHNQQGFNSKSYSNIDSQQQSHYSQQQNSQISNLKPQTTPFPQQQINYPQQQNSNVLTPQFNSYAQHTNFNHVNSSASNPSNAPSYLQFHNNQQQHLPDNQQQYSPVQQPLNSNAFGINNQRPSVSLNSSVNIPQIIPYPLKSISESTCYQVRDETLGKLRNFRTNVKHTIDRTDPNARINRRGMLDYWAKADPRAISMKIPKDMSQCILYQSHYSLGTYKKNNILGRFDVLQMPISLDRDIKWQQTNHAPIVLIFHAAGINIGESRFAQDFDDYAFNAPTGKTLDKDKYLDHMQEIFKNVLLAQQKAESTDIVWFPFGMGAFFRELHLLDKTYDPTIAGNDPYKLQKLRNQLAERFIQAYNEVDPHQSMTLHLCLDQTTPESTANFNAFKQGLANSQLLNYKIHENGDAGEIARKLAMEGKDVALTNGANRSLIGNHWMDNKAQKAIDENLHRKFFTLAHKVALLNPPTDYGKLSQYGSVPDFSRRLPDRLTQFGATVTNI